MRLCRLSPNCHPTKRKGGAPGRTPMRPVVVKSPGFLQHVSTPLSSRRAAPAKSGALRRQRARDAENHPIRRARWSPCVHTIESWRLRFAGALAPALLLSVAVPRTAHQRLMREAWTRAPLLELGVTSVNPSSQPGARPARGSPTGDRRVVLSALQRFQLRPDRDRPGF